MYKTIYMFNYQHFNIYINVTLVKYISRFLFWSKNTDIKIDKLISIYNLISYFISYIILTGT